MKKIEAHITYFITYYIYITYYITLWLICYSITVSPENLNAKSLFWWQWG